MTPELRLAAFVRAELGGAFVWGHSNCVALAMRAVDAMHGTALHAAHHRHMGSAARARAWTKRHGTEGLMAVLVTDGLTQIAPAYSQPGDILIGSTDDGQIAAHVCLGVRVLSVTPESGVIQIVRTALMPAPTMAAGWRPV